MRQRLFLILDIVLILLILLKELQKSEQQKLVLSLQTL